MLSIFIQTFICLLTFYTRFSPIQPTGENPTTFYFMKVRPQQTWPLVRKQSVRQLSLHISSLFGLIIISIKLLQSNDQESRQVLQTVHFPYFLVYTWLAYDQFDLHKHLPTWFGTFVPKFDINLDTVVIVSSYPNKFAWDIVIKL